MGKSYAQAGIERGADNPFAPLPNAYYQTALGALNEAGIYVQTNSDVQFYMNCLNSITNVYRIEGNYSGALDFLTGDVERGSSSPALQLANRPQIPMNMQGVINTLKQRKVNTDLLQAHLYNDLSAIYTQTGNLKQGLNYQIKCRNVLQQMHPVNEEEYLKASILLAKEYLLNRNEDSAILIRDHIETSINSDKDSGLQISYLDLKASVLQYQHNLSSAIQLYEQVFNQLKQFRQKHRYYYEMALQLGRLYMQTKQYKKADSVFRRNFNVLYQLQYKSVIFQQTAEGLCENMIYMKRYNEASDQLIKIARWLLYEVSINSVGMCEEDLSYYMPCLEKVFSMLCTVMNDYKMPEQNFIGNVLSMELQWKTRAYLGSYKLSQESMPYWDADLPLPYKGVRSYTKHLIWNEYSLPANKRTFDVDSLKEIWNNLERKISKQGSDMNDELKMNAFDIRTQGGTKNIEFIRYNYLSNNSTDSALYAAFVFEQDENYAVYVPLCSEKDILNLVTDKSGNSINENQLSDKLYNSSSDAIKLYNLIWAPLEPYIKNAHEINYSPAGILHNISFNAIYNGKNHLLNTCRLHQFLTITDAGIDHQQYDAPKEIHIWGNMNYDESAYSNKSLKPNYAGNTMLNQNKGIGTKPFENFLTNEPDTLKKIFNQYKVKFQICEYGYATEDSFMHATTGMKGVLQISTHGFYTPFDAKRINEPLPGNFIAGIEEPQFRCGLAFAGVNYYWKNGIQKKDFADGILTADEIERLQLNNVQLVALSACETGLGDVTHTEGNLGVYRAFKLSGAHYVLASLWEVPAQQTAKLFSLFYDNWLKGEPLDEALRNAQLTMQKDKDSSPFQWGAFVLIE